MNYPFILHIQVNEFLQQLRNSLMTYNVNKHNNILLSKLIGISNTKKFDHSN